MNAQLSKATPSAQPTLDFKQAVIISVLLTPAETAKLLHVTTGTLAVWRSTRRRPLRFTKLGWRVFYTREAIQEFMIAMSDPGDGKRPKRLRKKV
jgi:hypothetical protein